MLRNSFNDILDAAKHPIYDGCKGHSQLSLVARLMSLNTNYNLLKICMYSTSQIMQDYLRRSNNLMNSYYDKKKLMQSFGLSCKKIS